MGEITDAVNSGKPLDDESVDFLEAVIEEAPGYAEAYILLSRAYLALDDSGAALETLLDGQRELPDDPDICELLVRVLRDADEDELALENLDIGLTRNPNHVPLLSLAGIYLFEDGQEDDAKNYLARAEAIAPRHPMLLQARALIARMLEDEN
jgi:tetratricopeptide (TPR) repeat protein